MNVIRIEMERDKSQDSVWDQPSQQHRNFTRDALMATVVVVAFLAAAVTWACS